MSSALVMDGASPGASAPSHPHFLVLMAAHQGANYIESQVESILNQLKVTVRVVISVDPSTDSTQRVVDSLAAKYSNVTSFTSPGRPGAAQNFLNLILHTSLAGCDFVSLADQDDIWLPDKLARAASGILDRGVSAYSSNVLLWYPANPDASRDVLNKAQPQTQWDHYFSSAGPGCTYVFTAGSLEAFKSWLTTHATAFDASYHDWLLYAWYRAHGHRWYIDPEVGMLYRQHASNVLGANRGIRAAISRLRDIKRGWYVDEVVRVSSLVGAPPASPITHVQSKNLRRRLLLVKYVFTLRRSRLDSVMAYLAIAARRTRSQ